MFLMLGMSMSESDVGGKKRSMSAEVCKGFELISEEIKNGYVEMKISMPTEVHEALNMISENTNKSPDDLMIEAISDILK